MGRQIYGLLKQIALVPFYGKDVMVEALMNSEGRIITDFEGNYYICGWTSSDDGDVQSFNHG